VSDETPQDQRLSTDDQLAIEKRANQRRGLLPPIKPGEVRNKTGKNGREGRAELSQFLEDPSETDKGKTRFRRVLEKLYAKAIAGDTQAAKTLVEQHVGKPKQSMDLSNEAGDLAIPTVRIHFVNPRADDLPPATETAKADGR
jgi:hypothetical protein